MTSAKPDSLPAPFPPTTEAEWAALRQFIQTAPLAYGTWGALKRLYKRLEADPFTEPALFGALAARLDQATLSAAAGIMPVQLGASVRGIAGIAAADGIVYCLLGYPGRTTHLAIYDFRSGDLLKPKALGSIPVQGAHSIVLCGSFLCALGGGLETGILTVFDVQDPLHPKQRGGVDLGGYGRGVGVFPYVYLAVEGQQSNFSGLRIVDLTDPDQPKIIGEAEVKAANAVALDGTLAVVASGHTGFRWNRFPHQGGIRVMDIANPEQPRLLGWLNMSDGKVVAMRGSVAFVGVRNGLQVVDLTDPFHPRKAGYLATNQAPKAIMLHGDFAYLTLEYGYQQMVDIRRPDQPTSVSQINTYSAADIVISQSIAYVATPHAGLELYSVANPGKPTRIGTPPSAATLAYMKRRVRRFLRALAKKDADRYVRLAYEALAAARADKAQPGIDPASQWVTADILYGASDRYMQRRHGRGPLVPAKTRLRLRTREERAPEAWDRHLELASALLTDVHLPWQTHEAAYKMLRTVDKLPRISDALLGRFVSSPSPLLIRYSVHQVAVRLEGGHVPAPIAATAYVKAGVALRRAMESAFAPYAGDADWSRAFAQQVLDLASISITGRTLPRRLASACEFVARRFSAHVPANLVRAMTTALLNADRPGLTALVIAGARRASPDDALSWLQMLEVVAEPLREQVVQALAEGMAGQAFSVAEAQPLVMNPGSTFMREAGWRLLAASATVGSVIHVLWTGLLDSLLETPALRTAMTSPAALGLLTRAGLDADAIAQRLQDRPFLVAMLSAQTFATILASAPAALTLRLIAAASAEQWPEFRAVLLRRLREGLGLTELWLASEAALTQDADGRLETRLLVDADLAETFASVENPALLSLREPAFGPLLGRWARAHEALFLRNSPLLLQAATHLLPGVRDWALERVRFLGQDLPFALRLLESSLPASMDVGGAFFHSLTPGDPQEQTYALALCDSPFLPVRLLGQQFVTERWETLPHDALLQSLFESAYPDTQAFVAALLAQAQTRPGETVQFDRAVLRTRQKSRRAKEQVKARQSAEPTVDVETLLALARSLTPRDAEWALGELAKRALTGQEIEGFSLTGVAGG